MKRGNAICAGGGDDSRFTTVRMEAYCRASETGEDPDLLIKILSGLNNNIDPDQEITELALSRPDDWYGFYNPETGTGDFYIGGRTQNQKGSIPDDVKNYNKAKVAFYRSVGGLDTLEKGLNLAKAWFKTW